MTYAGDLTPEQCWEALRSNPSSVLVDCRTQAEWAYVGVPDLSELGKRVVLVEWVRFPDGVPNPYFIEQLRDHDIDDDAQVLFLCRSGQRSIGAAQAATAAGIGAAYNVVDGFEGALDDEGHRGSVGWKALGLPWRQS